MGAESARLQADRRDPVPHQAGLLLGRDMHGPMEPAWPQEFLPDHPRVLKLLRDRRTRAFGQLERDWLLSFALEH